MRKNLFSFLIRMAIVTVLMTGGTLNRTLGHDLPNYFPDHQLGADCLGVKLPFANANLAAPAIAPPAKPAAEERGAQKRKTLRFSNPSSALTMGIAYSETAWKALRRGVVASQLTRQLTKQLDQLSAFGQFGEVAAVAPRNELIAAFPDDAPAPSPLPRPVHVSSPGFSALVTTLALPVEKALVKQNYVEDYLPYDLCIRDWRFGQYSYRSLSRIAHVKQPAAEVANAAELSLHPPVLATSESLEHGEILGNALGRLSEIQCKVYSELCGFDSAYELGALGAKQLKLLSDAAAQQVRGFAQALTTSPRAPYYSQPVFVVYEMDGKSFMITAEQAVQWQTFRAALHPADIKPAEIKPADIAETYSIRKSLLNIASQKLNSLGNKLLNVAASIESFSDVQVAGRNERAVR